MNEKISKIYSEKMYNLGEIYFEDGEKQDYKKTLEYFEKAAQLGHAKALNKLGEMYNEGKGIKKSFEKALEYFEKAKELGNSEAFVNIGIIYIEGELVKKDYKKALEYFEKAKDLGNIRAYTEISSLYHSGKGVKKNLQKAIEYCKIAAGKEDSYALWSLGLIYLFDLKEYLKAKEYFEQAAEKGNEEAKSYLLKYNSFLYNEKKDLVKIFETEKEENENNDYYKKIKENIDKGSKIVIIKNIRELMTGGINRIPKDSIIFIDNNNDCTTPISQNLYLYSDMKKILKICNKFLEDIDLTQNEEDIFMQIYIKLGFLISYDYKAAKEESQERCSISRNMMTLINRKGVCAGYSCVLKNILDIVGIESIIVNSNPLYETSHAFNQVKVNGKWYFCDLTWDSSSFKIGSIDNCLKSKEEFVKDVFVKLDTYHTVNATCIQYEAKESYPNIRKLFTKNMLKILKKNISQKMQETIENRRGIK